MEGGDAVKSGTVSFALTSDSCLGGGEIGTNETGAVVSSRSSPCVTVKGMFDCVENKEVVDMSSL